MRSAAYDGGTMTASGTSMSSPYVAGCTAVLREYLEKQDIRLSGAEFAAYLEENRDNDEIFEYPRAERLVTGDGQLFYDS